MTVEQTFSVTYARCGFCAAKNHCAACAGELSAALSACEGVAAARVELPAGRAVVDHDLSPDDLEDLLDRRGLLRGEPVDKEKILGPLSDGSRLFSVLHRRASSRRKGSDTASSARARYSPGRR